MLSSQASRVLTMTKIEANNEKVKWLHADYWKRWSKVQGSDVEDLY